MKHGKFECKNKLFVFYWDKLCIFIVVLNMFNENVDLTL